MKTKVTILLLTCCLLALAAWLVHESNPAQADEIPKKYRETVNKGLEYLVKNQCEDGHWEGDGGKHPVAMTGLAGLALLMETQNLSWDESNKLQYIKKHTANVRKAADWLMDKSQARRDGLIFSGHPSETARYMQGHGLATLFLAGACRYEEDRELQTRRNDVLTRAVKYIVNAQSTQGGWYHTSKVEGHDFDVISATVIQIQALQAAENAGIPVPNDTLHDAQEYLKTAMRKYEEGAKLGQKHRNRPADTAAALACRFSITDLFFDEKNELCKKWFKYCQTEIPVGRAIQFGRDELTHYYYAQAVYSSGGDAWSGYRTAMFDHLQSSQHKDGSWPSGDGTSDGPVHATAVWCTILQLDGNGHPSTQRRVNNK